MKKILFTLALIAGCAFGQTFTDVNSANYWGKTDIPKLTAAIDANNALMESTTATVTNSEAFTITKTSTVLTGTGQANNYTNTITLAAVDPTLVGATVNLIVDTASTNLIGVADSGTANLSAAFVGDNEDALVLYVLSTNEFVEVSRTDN